MSRRPPSHLADEQAALRRVATLVASGATPEQVFQTVAEEAGGLLEARTAATVRFEPDCGLVVGCWSDGEGAGIEVGTRVPYSAPGSPVNVASHQGGRIDDYTDVPYRKRNWTPDGPRYKALGNSMAVPVMRWIGERIELVRNLK